MIHRLWRVSSSIRFGLVLSISRQGYNRSIQDSGENPCRPHHKGRKRMDSDAGLLGGNTGHRVGQKLRSPEVGLARRVEQKWGYATQSQLT